MKKYSAHNWHTEPISSSCEFMFSHKPEKLCGKRTVIAYPAMGNGWMALCLEHGQKHLPNGAFRLDELLESGEALKFNTLEKIFGCEAVELNDAQKAYEAFSDPACRSQRKTRGIYGK